MISIKCDECLKSYKVKPEMAGKKAKCKCGASIQIPSLKKKQAGGSSPRRKKPQRQPESDPWDEDPFDDDAFDTSVTRVPNLAFNVERLSEFADVEP